jgi:hypothetical protein
MVVAFGSCEFLARDLAICYGANGEASRVLMSEGRDPASVATMLCALSFANNQTVLKGFVC